MIRAMKFPSALLRVAVCAALTYCWCVGPRASAAFNVPATVQPAGALIDSSAADAQPYQLHAGDKLDISVLGHDELKSSLTVLPDGSITFPIAGRVNAAGLTAGQLATNLDDKLKGQCNQPQTTVIVEQAASSHASVLGGVHTPGVYSLRPGERVLGLIADAGGFDGDATLTQATLVTDQGAKSLPIDLAAVMSGQAMTDNFVLQADDILLLQKRDSSFNEIQVIGEVNKPSAYSVPTTGEPLLRAITDAGGATQNAALSRAQLMHAGQTTVLDLRSVNSSLASSVESIQLVPGDVLLIPANQERIAVLGGVRLPAAYTIPDGRTLTVTDAIAMAGGTVSDAQLHKAVILRHTIHGDVQQIPVDADPSDKNVQTVASASGSQTTPNAAIATVINPGDVLYIPQRGPSNGNNSMNALNPIASLLIAAGSIF